jgi:Hemerythrin HHE cation binding domain
MTTKDTDDRTAEAIDFTMMYVTHDAFRRDLGRFTTASAAGTPHAPGVRAGWEKFKAQLLLHHSVEDTHLWPRVRRAAAGRPAGGASGFVLKDTRPEQLLEAIRVVAAGESLLAPNVTRRLIAEFTRSPRPVRPESGGSPC